MIELIGNQPIRFDLTEDECRCGNITHNTIYQEDDYISFQYKLDPCADATEKVLDNQFETQEVWSFGVGWFWDPYTTGTPQAGHSAGSGQGDLTQSGVLDDNTYYRVEIVVLSITGVITVKLGNTIVATITTAGTHEVYGWSDGTDFTITANANTDCRLDSVSVKRLLLNQAVAIKDVVSDVILDIIYLLDYLNQNVTLSPPFSIVDNYITFFTRFDQSPTNYGPGCYEICLLDPCVNTCGQNGLLNPDFEQSNADWNLSATGGATNTINSSRNIFTSSGAGDTATTSQDIAICTGVIYDVDVELLTNPDVEISVRLGTNVIGTIPAGSLAGTYSFTGTTNGQSVSIVYTDIASAGITSQVDAVIISLASATDATPDYCSQEITIGAFSCTNYLHACPGNDAMGFVFEGSGFAPGIRLVSRLRNATYDIQRKSLIDTLGTRKVRYYERRKQKEFVVDYIPEFVNDFLSLLPGMQSIFINDEAYICVDNQYEQDYEDDLQDYSTLSIFVEETTQDIKNVLCELATVDCENIGGTPLLGSGVGGDDIDINYDSGEPIYI